MKKSLMIGALAAWVASTSPVWASDATLDEYVVSASRAKESVTEVAAAVTVIDAEAIENSSATDLGELLVEKGAVLVREYPGALSNIGIRGFKTESHGNDLMGNVLILIDGRRAGTGNAAKLATQNIERVEIIKGPAAVQYGSAAMGGVVNVITRKGDGKPSVFVNTKFGSYDYQEYGTGVSGSAGKFDFSATVSYSEEGDYETGDGTEYKNTGNDGILRGSINGGYELFPGHRLGLTYTTFKADKVGTPNTLENNDLDDYKDTENNSFDLTYDGKNSSETLSWQARYFGGKDEDKSYSPSASTPNPDPYAKETDSNGAVAQVSYDGDMFGLTTGVDWLEYDITSTSNPLSSTYTNTAGFAMGKVKLMDQKLIFLAGGRFDDYDVEIHKGQGSDKGDDDFNPSFGIVYNLNKAVKIRANMADAFRMPSAGELCGDYDGYYGAYKGNPDLKPEKSRTYEGGIDITTGGLKSGLTVFTSEYDQKITTTYVAVPGYTTYTNLDEATISGVEGELSYTFPDVFGSWELRPYVLATYLFKAEDAETNEDLKYFSDTNLSGGLSLSDLDGFYADLSASYQSEQDVDKWTFAGGNYTKTDAKLPSVTVVNFTVSKRVLATDKFGNLSLRGEVKNLFDEDAAYVLGYPIPGRRFFAGVTWNY